MNRAIRMPDTSGLLSLKSTAGAPGDPDVEAMRIAPGFANLAGSRENAIALAAALRDGRLVSLTMAGGEIVSIVSPIGVMTWKDAKMAMMLARDALARYGIVHPTGAQLQASLCGGEAPAPNGRMVSFRGVLCMRAEGMNWGRIAAERFLRPDVASRRSASLWLANVAAR